MLSKTTRLIGRELSYGWLRGWREWLRSLVEGALHGVRVRPHRLDLQPAETRAWRAPARPLAQQAHRRDIGAHQPRSQPAPLPNLS